MADVMLTLTSVLSVHFSAKCCRDRRQYFGCVCVCVCAVKWWVQRKHSRDFFSSLLVCESLMFQVLWGQMLLEAAFGSGVHLHCTQFLLYRWQSVFSILLFIALLDMLIFTSALRSFCVCCRILVIVWWRGTLYCGSRNTILKKNCFLVLYALITIFNDNNNINNNNKLQKRCRLHSRCDIHTFHSIL